MVKNIFVLLSIRFSFNSQLSWEIFMHALNHFIYLWKIFTLCFNVHNQVELWKFWLVKSHDLLKFLGHVSHSIFIKRWWPKLGEQMLSIGSMHLLWNIWTSFIRFELIGFYCCNSEEYCNLTKKRATTKSNLIAQKRQSQINCTKFRTILIILQVKIGFTKLRCIITSMGMQ